MNTSPNLIISEQFYSIQGEGPSMGSPAVFLRLTGCNFRCLGFSYQDPEKQTHLGCDSRLVWQKGKKFALETIISEWRKLGWLKALEQGAHLILTGGEPTLQQSGLRELLQKLDELCASKIYVELETNGSKLLLPELLERINQINLSPKLGSSGEPRHKAYRPEILAALAQIPKVNFKFVLMEPSDIDEIIQEYVEPFQISSQRIWLMPEGGTREAIHAKSPWVVELCKKYCMHYSSRLQIDIWGEVTGV